MGYTNYWHQNIDFTEKQWKTVQEEVKYMEEISNGNIHLLTNDNSYWDQIKALLNGLIILNTPIDICKERVIVRRVTQGKTKEASTKHWEKNDLHIHTRINNAIQTLNTNNLLQNIPTLLLYPCVYIK